LQGFISEQLTTINDLGVPETRLRPVKGNKSKGKQGKNRKNVQKAKYKFNRVVVSSVEYSNYFNPDSDVEGRIVGLLDKVRDHVLCPVVLTVHLQKAHLKSLRQAGVPTLQPSRTCSELAQAETQTQDETQLLASLSLSDIGLKQSHALPDVEDDTRPKKRIKVSVAHGVDLAE
jgi:hypothetical protein